MKIFVGLKGELEGVYFAHWEVSRFVVLGEPRLWGTSRDEHNCELELAEKVEAPWFKDSGGKPPANRRQSGAVFDVRLEGEVIEQGSFGHKGLCRWRIRVSRFLKVEKRS